GRLPDAGRRRDRQAQPRCADPDALQRAQFHPGSDAADAGEGADHDDGHPHHLRRLMARFRFGRAGLRVLLAALSLLGGVAVAEEPPSAAQMMDDLMFGRGTVGGPFTLIDQNGRRRSDRDFRGKLMIVYFGYTFCPDVCPTDLMAITQALDALGP